jgi:hypothetical protein
MRCETAGPVRWTRNEGYNLIGVLNQFGYCTIWATERRASTRRPALASSKGARISSCSRRYPVKALLER